MKIAIVTDTYFPRINGVSVSTRIFAREFCRQGHEVHVHAPAFPDKGEDNEPFRVIRYPSLYLAFEPEDRMGYGFRKEAKAFIGQNYDIVHTQTPFFLGQLAVKWARKSGAKVVHTYHTFYRAYAEYYFWYLPKRLKTYSAEWISKKYCNSCDLIVAPAPHIAREVASYRVKTPIVIIPTGVMLSQFEGKDGHKFRSKMGFSEKEKILLYVGRLADEKNIDFLLRVFARIANEYDNARFVIAGSGPALSGLKDLASRLRVDEKTHFLGYIKGNVLRDCYAAADLFLFASVTETQGLSVLESMAAGVPVVAVGRMGVKDIFEMQKGGIATEPDEDEFFRAVVKMLKEPDLYRQKKMETGSVVKNWSSEAMADRTLNEYEKLLEISVSISGVF
ncbi:MAG: glycosyltransferase [Candidatus Paceibacterota bacterium]